MKFTTRSFLLRRRIDSWLLLAGAVSQPLRIGFAGLVTFLISCIGVYLVAIRHRSVRLFSNRFQLFAVLYALWSCGLILWRSEQPLEDRQLGYSLLFALFAFAGPGMVLIARPMRMFVIGSRIGIVLALLAAIGISILYGGRIGIGGNQAVFAFVVAAAAVAATIPIDKAPRWLPNGPYYLIIGCGAAVLSETRAVMAVLPIFAAIELVVALRRYGLRTRVLASAVGLAVLLGAGMTSKVQDVVTDRWISMTSYYAGLSKSWSGRSSADIRLALWDGAVKVISKHPIIGVGSEAKMQLVRDELDAKFDKRQKLSRYMHVHNSLLDELLGHGVIGLSLMLAAIVSAAGFAWRNSNLAAERRNLAYFLLLTIAYGMLHNPFLHETTLAAFFLYLGVFHAAVSRRRLEHVAAK